LQLFPNFQILFLGTIATFPVFEFEKRRLNALVVPAMPVGRYFLFVGSALLSLLYLADWYLPRLAAEPAHSEVDRTIIRIHSEHQWRVACRPALRPMRGMRLKVVSVTDSTPPVLQSEW
jgi:hypothetical protein